MTLNCDQPLKGLPWCFLLGIEGEGGDGDADQTLDKLGYPLPPDYSQIFLDDFIQLLCIPKLYFISCNNNIIYKICSSSGATHLNLEKKKKQARSSAVN